jgi:hypothetical protein
MRGPAHINKAQHKQVSDALTWPQERRGFKSTLRVASANGVGALVVHGTFVEVLHAVPLGLDRRRQMAHHHLEQSLMID